MLLHVTPWHCNRAHDQRSHGVKYAEETSSVLAATAEAMMLLAEMDEGGTVERWSDQPRRVFSLWGCYELPHGYGAEQ